MADDVVFQEAVDALRAGNKTKARELLTGLLKTDQNNATYWIWMSALVDTPKERIYCLQTAFKLDPENITAKRGLILHGALPADETIQPFPLNRPRAWEERLLLAHEKPKPKGWQAVKASPVFRLGLVILLLGAIAAGVVFGYVIPTVSRQSSIPTSSPGPSPTYTPTPTSLNAPAQPVVIGTENPFNVQYTATPLYVNTPRPPQSSDMYYSMKPAYEQGNWDEVIRLSQEILKVEPEAADIYYYMGEAYRFKGDPGQAAAAYESALSLTDNQFGPAFVGLARARLLADSNANVLPLLEQAINIDPNFGEAYIESARVKLRDNNAKGALQDLSEANKRLPNSPLVFYYTALAQRQENATDLALQAAERSLQWDVSYMPTYLLLGQLYAETGNYVEANRALDVYLKYEEGDAEVYLLLGKIQFNQGNYAGTLEQIDKVIKLDRNRREAYRYRFLSHVELGNGDPAEDDIDRMISFYPEDFDINLAIVRTYTLKEKFGTAELSLPKAESLAETDEQKALVYYWSAQVFEKRSEQNPGKAAQYWQKLLDLPEDAMTAEMRAEAEKRLLALQTPTPTAKPGSKTATPTRTPSPTRTPTPTATK